ncbi:MAG TPA: FAD-dependent oxidoreductase [Fimbriimonas sp.]
MRTDDAVAASTKFPEIHPPLNDRQAFLESERCLECGGPNAPAPCVAACPADVDVPRFIREIREGHAGAAGETVFASNVLGGSCARVCPVDELCEGACVMHREGRRPVEIGRLQRYATDHALASLPSAPIAGRQLSVGVIGAGPAGLACAMGLAQSGYEVTVYEKRPLPGGLVTYAIAPYKQVVEPIPAEVERVRRMGVDIKYGFEIGKDVTIPELQGRHEALFIGAGMGADTRANLPGEDLEGVWESLPFIEQIKLSEPPKLGKKLAVIGGGNTAIDVVREAIRLGVEEVTLIYRRSEEQMPAFRHEVEAARAEGVRFHFLTAPLRFLGETSVTGIECLRMELGEPDSSGRPRPVAVPGSEFVVDVDTVVKAIGQRPRTELLETLGVECKWGNVVVGPDMATSVAGVFAGGDCINGGSTVVEAVAHGKAAAESIHAYLSGETKAPVEKRPVRQVQEGPVDKHYQDTFYLGLTKTLCKGCLLCVQSCPTEILYLDAKSKIDVTDIDRCVFCGMCEARCPDFAIWISKNDASNVIEEEALRRLSV